MSKCKSKLLINPTCLPVDCSSIFAIVPEVQSESEPNSPIGLERAGALRSQPAEKTGSDPVVRPVTESERFSMPGVNAGGYVEITLTFPHESREMALRTSQQQKSMFDRLFASFIIIKGIFKIEQLKYDRVFEYHKDGNVHCHGIIEFPESFKHYTTAMIMDMVKHYYGVNKIPLSSDCKKRRTYNPKHMYVEYNRYKDPGILLQWRNMKDPGIDDPTITRHQEWVNYMRKQQFNN